MLKSCPESYTIDNFALGLDWASPPDRLSKMSVYDAKNINLTAYKSLEKRSGMSKYYSTPYVSGQSVLDIYEYVSSEATYVLVLTNTATESKLGYYNSGWHDLKTGLTRNARAYFATHNEYCFVTNGTDDNFKLKSTTVSRVGLVAPVAAPTVASTGLSGALTGSYYYVYCYKRSTAIGPETRSDPSPASALVIVEASTVNVTYVASSDTQVDYIEIYRSLDVSSSDNSTSQYYLVTTVANANGTYTDSTLDDELSALCPVNNAPPPKAYFCALHKDRMFYANCPSNTSGESLFMFSEVGRPESCPSINYQYFDRSDGNEITGIASLPDYLIVFKKNKIAALEGDFSQWYTISATTGCIAPWAIIKFQDQIMFLSEEGWKTTDGRAVMDVSKKLIALNKSQYISYGQKLNYSGAYYPSRKQCLFLLNHASYTKVVMVGHLLSSLYSDVSRENTVDEPYIGWTYHQYDDHTLTTLGKFTDSNGVDKILAGGTLGYIYLLDDGTQDDGNDIEWKIETGWHNFDVPLPLSKQLRILNFVYSSNSSGTIDVDIDVDYTNDVDSLTLTHGTGSYCGYVYCNEAYPGLSGVFTENQAVAAACIGRKFRFRLSDTSGYDFALMSISAMFRVSGLREGI